MIKVDKTALIIVERELIAALSKTTHGTWQMRRTEGNRALVELLSINGVSLGCLNRTRNDLLSFPRGTWEFSTLNNSKDEGVVVLEGAN